MAFGKKKPSSRIEDWPDWVVDVILNEKDEVSLEDAIEFFELPETQSMVKEDKEELRKVLECHRAQLTDLRETVKLDFKGTSSAGVAWYDLDKAPAVCMEAALEASKRWEVESKAKRKLEDARRSREKLGVVYFIQRVSGGSIKIGKTTRNVSGRISDMQTAHSETLVCLATMDGGAYMEGVLHERFKEHRLSGEWFRPHWDILALVAMLRAS